MKSLSELRPVNQTRISTKFRNIVFRFSDPLIAILLALVIGSILIIISGHNPIQAYISLVQGAFSNSFRFGETLVKTAPLVIMGLGISIAFKNSFWNIGGDGQFIMGGILSTWVALAFSHIPAPILAVACFLAAFIGGAIWCLIAGLLKSYFNVNEILSTLMLNYIALAILSYLIRGPMKDMTGAGDFTGQVMPQSAAIPNSQFLPLLISQTRVHAGIIIAIIACLLVWILWRTTTGFQIELNGASREAANYAGVNSIKIIILTSILSGGLAGIVGWNEIFGIFHRLLDAITSGYGFLGIVVALLGGLSPWGTLLSAFLFSSFVVGGNSMERSLGVSYSVIDIISGLIILFVLVRGLVLLNVIRRE